MRLAINDAFYALAPGVGPEAPVQIETIRVRVQFNPGARFGAGVDDGVLVQFVGLAFQQQASGQMTEDMDVRIPRGADDAFGHLRFAVAEALVDARHNDIEFRQQVIGKVEFAVRRDVGQVEFLKNVFLRFARHPQLRVAGFLLRLKQAVFVEAQAAFDGALAHDDVVVLAAGEVGERERKLRVSHNAQVGLNATLQDHTGLGVAFGAHAHHAGLAREKLDDLLRVLRRYQKINVANDLLESPHAAGGAATNHVGMAAQILQHRFGDGQRVAKQMSRRIGALELDAFENFALSFLTEAVEPRDLRGLAGRFELFDRLDAALAVQRFDFLRAEDGDLQHLNQARLHRGLQAVVVGQFAGGDQFSDFFLDAFADAFDFAEPI